MGASTRGSHSVFDVISFLRTLFAAEVASVIFDKYTRRRIANKTMYGDYDYSHLPPPRFSTRLVRPPRTRSESPPNFEASSCQLVQLLMVQHLHPLLDTVLANTRAPKT